MHLVVVLCWVCEVGSDGGYDGCLARMMEACGVASCVWVGTGGV